MELEDAVLAVREKLKDPEKVKEEQEVVDKFQRLFRYENIDNISAEQFQSFLDPKENNHWPLSRLKTVLTRDMSKLQTALKILLDSSLPLENRLQRLRDRNSPEYMEFMGKAIFSPILLVTNPSEYPVFNGTVERAFKKLEIHLENESQPIWKLYTEVQDIIKGMASKYGLSLWEMDWVWWEVVSQKKKKDRLVNEKSLWVVRAGSKGEQEKDALENNVVTIAWNELPDLSSVSDKQSLKQLYMKTSPNTRKMAVANMVGSIWRFVKKIKERDLVFLPLLSQDSNTIAVGRVEGDYNYKELAPEIKHIRPVKWLAKNILKSEFDEDIIKQFQRRMTVYEIKGNDVVEQISKVLNKYGIGDTNINVSNLEADLKLGTERAITLEVISRQTYFPIDTIKEVEILLSEKKQIIFYGPPGTSKTYFAKAFARYFTGNPDSIALIQFHPSYSYEDFIEGIKPNLSETGQAFGFSKQDGFFKRLVYKCNADPNSKYVLIIDEINRGNISKIFGELIYLLEYRKEKVVRTYSPNESFSIPSNLYIIGTMNSADRSIAFVDYALRRRFYFKNFYPDSIVNLLREWFEDHPPIQIDSEKIIRMLEEINRIIVEKLGREYQIGHSYLMKENLDNNTLKRIIDYAIIPLLEQYFFGKKERLEELKEIFNRTTIVV